ncbi:MAG: spheroidene monooxygenase [Paracoccaceae bacterium]
MTQVVSLSFFHFATPVSKLWAFAMMGIARGQMAAVPDIEFWKLCGSGSGEGFTPIPNTGVYAILATWPDEATARARTQNADIYCKYHTRADESWTVYLSTASARGAWSGDAPFRETSSYTSGPLAVLTRASLRPAAAVKFWQKVPDISTVIGDDTNVLFKIGIGEVPWLQQVTFSIWPDTSCMRDFAHKDGPHARAIKAVRDGNWFREELYARFTICGDYGTWGGSSPLTLTEVPA